MKSVQWTAKLAHLADEKLPAKVSQSSHGTQDLEKKSAFASRHDEISISLRLEGPYLTPADPHRYDTVVCIVAGTGVTGAVAIASAFVNLSPANTQSDASSKEEGPAARCWRRCIVLWSVKASEDIDLPLPQHHAGLEVRKFLTGEGRERVDLEVELEGSLKEKDKAGNRSWVYISGPQAFINAGKQACTSVQNTIGRAGIDFYAASWSP